MKENGEIIRTPNYYIRKRLINNLPAMFGLGVILLAALVSILGYLIMPDQTPYANDGAIQIQKRLPGFQTYMLKKRRNVTVEKKSFIEKMFTGQESEYIIVPIKKFELKGFNVEIIPEGRIQIPETIPLIEIVTSVKLQDIDDEHISSNKNYTYQEDKVIFTDMEGSTNTLSQKELQQRFYEYIESRTFLLGTDKAGRDLLSRLLYGTRISLGIGLISVMISLLVGLTIGSVGGFFGGRIDAFVMWLMTVVWSIPGIILVIAISLALQSKGIWVAFIAVGLTSWVEIARVVRGQILSIKEKTYIEAARALGIKNFQIIVKHILPNLMGPIIVIATSNFASAILTEAGLSFLGLGVQPPMPSWGMMVNEGFHSMGTLNSWHLILFPSLAISLLVFAFNLFGNGLRDAYDPQHAIKW